MEMHEYQPMDLEPNPVQEPEYQVSLDLPDYNPLPPEQAAKLAKKIKYSLPQLSKDLPQIYQTLVNEGENNLRKEAALTIQTERDEALYNDLQKYLNNPLFDKNQFKNYFRTYTEESTKQVDPSTVFEKAFAKQWVGEVDRAADRNPDSDLARERRENPKAYEAIKGKADNTTANLDYARTVEERAKQRLKNQSYFGFGVDLAKQIAPFYSQIKLRGNVEGVGFFEEGFLGLNKEAQRKKLLSLPHDQFKVALDRIDEKLGNDNPLIAVEFASSIVGMSSSDVFLDNMFSAADVAFAGFDAKMIAGMVNTRRAMKEVTKAAATKEPTAANAADAVGDASESAVRRVADGVVDEVNGYKDPTKEALEALPKYLRTDRADLEVNPGTHGRELTNRLRDDIESATGKFMYTLSHMLRVERLPFNEASLAAVRAMQDGLRKTMRGVDNMVMDMSNPIKNKITNTWHMYIDLGQSSAEYFPTKMAAYNMARHLRMLDHELVDQGTGWSIRVRKPIDETDDYVRDWLIKLDQAHTPKSLISIFGWARTADDVLVGENVKNRKVGVYGPNVIMKLLDEQAKYIRDLRRGIVRYDPVTGEKIGFMQRTAGSIGAIVSRSSKQMFKEWEQILKAGQKQIDPDTGLEGYWYKNAAEVEFAYMKHLRRLPNPIEIEAYFAFKRLHEMDRVLRDISVYRNMSRNGVEEHQFFFYDSHKKRVNSGFIPGMLRKELPAGPEDPILIMGDRAGQEQIYRRLQLSPQMYGDLKKKIATGELKVIEIWDPELRKLNDFMKGRDERIRWVVTKNVETRNLEYSQVARRGGGHIEYDYEWYIKQPRIVLERIGDEGKPGSVVHWYEGDTTVMPIAIRRMGENAVKHLNAARVLLDNNDVAGAKAYVQRHLPIPWDEFHGWFNPSFDKITRVWMPARLSTEHEFRVVPRNRSITDLDKTLEKKFERVGADDVVYNTFRDGTKKGSAARANQVEYTRERDAVDVKTLTDHGTRGNPLFKYEPAQVISPIPSMDRALTRITNSTFLDDYKISSVEHWLKEASGFLKASDPDIKSSPFYHFYEAGQGSGAWKSASGDDYLRLKAAHFQIRQLLGYQTDWDTWFQSVTQKLADSIYGKVGPKFPIIGSVHAMAAIKDPFKYIRAATFHFTLGLFAIPQLLVQSQTYAAILAIGGFKYAAPGTKMALLAQLARHNPSDRVMKVLDKIASTRLIPGTQRIRPGDFLEAFTEMRKTGFGEVAGEHALIDSHMSPKLFRSFGKDILDGGAFFFREGERNSRYGAYFTAFLEWRAKNPTKAITDVDRRQILSRADLMSVNMSRASSSVLHTGIMTVPGQFYSFQIRLAEQMLGKRLTRAEKARMIAWYAGLYGAPVATGLTGIPMSDWLRRAALENGYVVGENDIETLVTEGIPSYLLALATGGGNIRDGKFVNIGPRLGPGGFEFLRESVGSDSPFMDALGGAAWSKIKGFGDSIHPFYSFAKDWVAGEGKFKLTPRHFIQVAKELTIVNQTDKALFAMNYGIWLSKKEDNLTEVGATEGILMALTGTQPQSVDDLHNMSVSLKDVQKWERKMTKYAVQELRRGWRAMEDNNPDQSQQYFVNALTALKLANFPENKIMNVLKLAAQGNESMVARIKYDFYIEKVPAQDRLKKLERYNKSESIGK